MPGDSLIPASQLDATRGIEIGAPPESVFPWLVQMGPGRAGWYSYDWIDNAGRPSATVINQEWQSVNEGDSLGSQGGSNSWWPSDATPMTSCSGSRSRARSHSRWATGCDAKGRGHG